MIVEELLHAPELNLDVRVRGDADRLIRWVHTIRGARPLPAPPQWRGRAHGWRAAGVTAESFVADLADSGAEAVGSGIVPPETSVPEEFVTAARERGLTCFVVPVAVPLLQLVELFVSAKHEEWERPLPRHLGQHDAMVAPLRVRRGWIRSCARCRGRCRGAAVGGVLEGAVPLVAEGIADAELLLPHPGAARRGGRRLRSFARVPWGTSPGGVHAGAEGSGVQVCVVSETGFGGGNAGEPVEGGSRGGR